jgi:hypothetical protein
LNSYLPFVIFVAGTVFSKVQSDSLLIIVGVLGPVTNVHLEGALLPNILRWNTVFDEFVNHLLGKVRKKAFAFGLVEVRGGFEVDVICGHHGAESLNFFLSKVAGAAFRRDTRRPWGSAHGVAVWASDDIGAGVKVALRVTADDFIVLVNVTSVTR